MRILIVHNHYGDYATGGEGNVMRAEAELLRSHGHDVQTYERTNSEIYSGHMLTQIADARQADWSTRGYKAVASVLDHFQPEIMHVHNYKFLLSPSIFLAAKERGVATVLTLHNYGLVSPCGQLLRNGTPCERCIGGAGWPILWHRCYPGGSLLKSVLALHVHRNTRKRGFLREWVDAYIALTEFGRHKFVGGGLPPEKLSVKPNFMTDPLDGRPPTPPGEGAIYVGRLSPEKGVLSLLAAWRNVNYPLTIVGDGPQMSAVRRAAGSHVTVLGNRSHDDVLRLIEKSAYLVFPSESYEGLPLTVIESMALGRAVIATDLGPRREIVRDGESGLLYRCGDAQDLTSRVRQLNSDRSQCASMGTAARRTYLAAYTPATNYQKLIQIYEGALARNGHPAQQYAKA